MKFAVLTESPADAAAIRVLVDGLLGGVTEPPNLPRMESRDGWTRVLAALPTILKGLHYGQPDVDALVVVIDSDESPPHRKWHDEPDEENGPGKEKRKRKEKCRLCMLRRLVKKTWRELSPSPRRSPLKTAVGLAVPAIEAWYLVGRDPHVSETAWTTGIESGKPPYTRQKLKMKVYATDRPFLRLETERAKKEAQRIVDEGKLPLLEQHFPAGFGAIVGDIRNW